MWDSYATGSSFSMNVSGDIPDDNLRYTGVERGVKLSRLLVTPLFSAQAKE